MNGALTKSERETLKAIWRLTSHPHLDGGARTGDRAVVALPGSTDPEVARFLDGLGVRPGVEVEIREKHPFDGPLVVSVDGHDRTIGEKVARQILVRTETTNHKRRKEPSDHVAPR